MKNKKLWLAPFVLAGAGIIVLGARNPGNVAQTAPNHADARLRTRHYKTSMPEAYRQVLAAITSLRTYGKSWRVVSHEENEVRVEVPVFAFTDDLIVTLKAAPDGVVLDVRSASRVGKGDFGENRRHILQLLSLLDEKLPSLK